MPSQQTGTEAFRDLRDYTRPGLCEVEGSLPQMGTLSPGRGGWAASHLLRSLLGQGRESSPPDSLTRLFLLPQVCWWAQTPQVLR